MHDSARNAPDRNESVTLQIAEFARRGDPHSPASILKKRTRSNSIEFPVAPVEGGDLPILPLVQTTSRREPDTSIPGRQDGPGKGIRQALFHRKRRDGKFAKAVETVKGSRPKCCPHDPQRGLQHVRSKGRQIAQTHLSGRGGCEPGPGPWFRSTGRHRDRGANARASNCRARILGADTARSSRQRVVGFRCPHGDQERAVFVFSQTPRCRPAGLAPNRIVEGPVSIATARPSLPPRECPCCLRTDRSRRSPDCRPRRSTGRCHCRIAQSFPGGGNDSTPTQTVPSRSSRSLMIFCPPISGYCVSLAVLPTGQPLTGPDPERAVARGEQAVNLAGGEMLIRWRLPGDSSDPIEANEGVLRSQPEIAVGRLGNRGDGAFGKALADLPRRVRVLTDVERRIERERTRAPRQQQAREQHSIRPGFAVGEAPGSSLAPN